MILFIDSKGNQIKTIAETIYQGSNLANDLVVVAPLSQSLSAYLSYRLPNGFLSQPILMTPYSDINTIDNALKDVSAWKIQIPSKMTAYYGQVIYQIRFVNTNGQIIASCGATFQVQRGVAPILPIVDEEEPQTAYEEVLQALANIRADILNGYMESKGLLPYDSTFEYKSNTLVFTNADGLVTIYRSLVADNENKPLTDTESWQNLGQIATREYVDEVLQTIVTQSDVDTAIGTHNTSGTAHQDIRTLISHKPGYTNSYSNANNICYSAGYSNNHFAPLSFVSNLYAKKDTSGMPPPSATLISDMTNITIDDANVLANISTNTTWERAFTFKRVIDVPIEIGNNNNFTLSVKFQVSRDCTLSWGGRIKVSNDSGDTWTYLDTEIQPTSSQEWATGVGNTINISMQITELSAPMILQKDTSILMFEVYKKQESATLLTTEVYCGVEYDGINIYTTLTYNFTNVYLNTEQIVDGAITYSKLDSNLQSEIDKIINIGTKTDKGILTYDSVNDEYNAVAPDNQVTNSSDNVVTSSAVYDYIANGIPYLTTAPISDNTSGRLIVVVLSSEPVTKYNGYLYLIKE